MNAIELIIHLTERRIESLFETARTLPADKLDWQPAPGARSALDQLQEVATALPVFWGAFSDKKMEWDAEQFAKWKEDREKLTTIDELEKVCKENTNTFFEFIKKVPESELTDPVQMPFPGPMNYADILAYHLWNAGYHQGQITYIKSLLD